MKLLLLLFPAVLLAQAPPVGRGPGRGAPPTAKPPRQSTSPATGSPL